MLSSVIAGGGGKSADATSRKETSADGFKATSRKGNNWNYDTELAALAARLGQKVKDVPSLVNSLQQEGKVKTVSTGTKQIVMKDNRLSVLGRSTMMHYVNEYLHFSYPMMDGSMLTDLADFITSRDSLVKLADHFGVTDLIRSKSGFTFQSNPSTISQSFCGILGAIYCDQGPKSTKKLVHDVIIAQLSGCDLQEIIKLQHPRFMLNAILSSQKRQKPVSRLISESGRATHFPSFVVGIFSGDNCLGEGTGTSLRRAEVEAMRTALHIHFQKELSATPLPSDNEEFSTEEELKSDICTIKEKEKVADLLQN